MRLGDVCPGDVFGDGMYCLMPVSDPSEGPVPYMLALDQDTTGSRTMVIAHDGTIKGGAYRELAQPFPRAGWVEQDPQEIWTSQVDVVIEALERADVLPPDIAAVGIATQREAALL